MSGNANLLTSRPPISPPNPDDFETPEAYANAYLLWYGEQHPDALITQLAFSFLERRPKTLEHYINYTEAFYGLRFPTNGVCHGHTAPGVVWWKHFNDEVFDSIIIGSRESGKTIGYATIDHQQMFFNGDEIANVGAVDAQAKKCYSYIQGFCNLKHFRGYMKKPPMLSLSELKNGGMVEVMPATMNRVNSPHPRIANADEVELMPVRVMNEMVSMPKRMRGCDSKDRPPAIRYTSSRKKAYGPLEELLKVAKHRGLEVFTFCVFEVAEKCPEERHQNGDGCRSGCPLAVDCLYQRPMPDGTLAYEPGPGRAAYANGWMRIDDIIRQKKITDALVWESQWLSKKPLATGLVYPTFDMDVHVLANDIYDWNPALPVFAGQDFGYTAPGCVLYAQMLPTQELIIFAEDYTALRITPVWAQCVKATPWFRNLKWVAGDPAAADGRATMQDAGVPMLMANNEIDRGLSRVRYLLAPPERDRPMLYVSERCVNFISEIQSYHHPDVKEKHNPDEEPESVNDHSMDALRYLVAELYGGLIAV